jgi:hypothetical protein
MPNPKSLFSIDEINNKFYNLQRIAEVNRNQYIYRVDDEHSIFHIRTALQILENARNNFHDNIITFEEFEERYQIYLNATKRHTLIDEDGSICGYYFSDTREYDIFCKRIIINNEVCYHNNNIAFTRLGNCMGNLTNYI